MTARCNNAVTFREDVALSCGVPIVDIMDGKGITQAIGDFDPIFKQIQKAGYTGGKAQSGETEVDDASTD